MVASLNVPICLVDNVAGRKDNFNTWLQVFLHWNFETNSVTSDPPINKTVENQRAAWAALTATWDGDGEGSLDSDLVPLHAMCGGARNNWRHTRLLVTSSGPAILPMVGPKSYRHFTSKFDITQGMFEILVPPWLIEM